MAPLHYFATRPTSNVQEYAADARWARSPDTRIVFIDPKTHFLKTQLVGETENHIVVPAAMSDFLISSNLDVCVYRSTNGSVCVWRKHHPNPNTIWSAASSISMEQIAFNPSGELIAFVPDDGNEVHVFDVRTGTQMTQTLGTWFKAPRVAWLSAEARFVVTGNATGHSRAVVVENEELAVLPHDSSDPVKSLFCYSLSARGCARGRFGHPYSDTCGDLKAWVNRGLGRQMRIYRENEGDTDTKVAVAANPGLLHLGGLRFTEVAFLDGCDECLFVAEGHVYLLDIPARRVGAVTAGNRVVPFTPRFLR